MTTRSFSSFFLSAFAAAIALPAITSMAQAQSTALPAITSSIAPMPKPIGLSITGWQMSSGIGQGYNIGGDGKGLVNSYSGGNMNLGAEAYLTGNSNPDCKIGCGDTMVKQWITGNQSAGAYAQNQGGGTPEKPVVSVAGTNGILGGSVITKWEYTLPPTPAP